VIGSHLSCPLCQRELEVREGEKEDDEDLFPKLEKLYKRNLVFKIITFVSCLLIIISIFLNLLLSGGHGWAYIIVAAVCCFWISFYIAFRKRKNVEKAILYMEVLLSVLSLLWDYFTGRHGWAMDFVLPGLGMVTLLALLIISRCMHAEDDDDLIYLIIGSLISIVPLIFYGLHLLHYYIPSLICAASGIIFLTAVLIFQGDRMMGEIQRRMHV
jgi:MFS family permease